MGKEIAKTWHDAVKIFVPPKKPYDLRLWRDVQVWFWRAVSLGFVWCILPWVVQIIKLIK